MQRLRKIFVLSILGLLICTLQARGQTLPKFGHVVIVPLENHSYSQVVGSSSMPYLNSLISKYGLATNYTANTHPSIGNYFMLTTGQILTNDDGQTPSSFPVSADNIAHEVEAAGKTWKDYPEKTGSYIVRHDPLQYMTNINKANLTSFTQFKTDLANHALPNFSFITPNGCDDAHDCGLSTADSWLKSNIDPLVQSSYLQPGGDGLLIIVFDEDDHSEGNRVACVIVSPFIASAGFKSSNSYHHQNALKLMAAALGLSTSGLSAAASASNMSEFFHAVTTASTVTLLPSSLSFGNQTVGTTSAAKLATLTNTGTTTVTISGETVTGDYALAGLGTCGTSLAPGSSCAISVTFKPTATGTRTGSVTITDSATGSPQKISLTGSGVSSGTSTPVASLSPTSLAFGNQTVGTTSAARVITLSNTGTASLSISGIAVTGTNSGDFAQTHTCGASLAAGTSCTISVTFRPAATGARTASVAVTDNASGSPHTAALSGSGVSSTTSTPVASLSPTSLAFGNQTVGTTSAAKVVTLSNTGSAALSITSIAVAGTNVGDFTQTHTCLSSLAAGARCTISVTFKPAATGTRSARVSVTDNASGSPQAVVLSGSGVSSSTTGPAVSLSPTSLAFGNQTVGTTSAVKYATLTNTGHATLTFSGSFAISGDFHFAGLGTCGSSVAAGASCTISVKFTPTATGTRTGTVTLNDNAPNTPQRVPLTGTGVSTSTTGPAVSLSPSSLSFGNQAVGTTSAVKFVTLTNTGHATLTFSGGFLISGNFAFAGLGTCGSSVAVGASCTISVKFTPTATGARTGVVTLNDNAPNTPQRISLSGSGT